MTDAGTRITTAVREAVAAATPAAVAHALHSIEPDELGEFFHTRLATTDSPPLGSGLAASPGAASGCIVLSSEAALDANDAGTDVILVRPETSPDDVAGMQVSRGIVTMRGGLVSHAAVVARGWGIPAVVGADDVSIEGDRITIGTTTLSAGDEITIDGSSGAIYAGRLATAGTEPPAELATLLSWADTVADGHVQVRVNADTAGDAGQGRDLGAVGIGLCRTEHMFLAADRLPIVRRFILADDPATEAAALAELERAQEADFEQLLEAMDTLPVTVRLLDPPLHEFLPDLHDLTAKEAAGTLDGDERTELAAARRLHETNPMIGTRGVRLGVVRPGLYQMQVRALCTAAAALFERGLRPHVEIMIPLVVDADELRIARSWVTDVLDEIGHPELASGVVTIGAMVETPRAALTAGELAAHADFFSFGTNDLTQMTYAFSRDDVAARLVPAYLEHGILDADPFDALDQHGVGRLVRIACEDARAARSDIKLGACGEHAGHPASADFLVRLGVDSVSCSPFRVPMARLAVARSLLASGRVDVQDVEYSYAVTGEGDGVNTPAGDGAPTSDDAPSIADASVPVDEFAVLHVLRVRGFLTPAGFVESLGVHPEGPLTVLVESGKVRHVEARDMYMLLPEGKERHAEVLGLTTTEAVRSGLGDHYPAFLELNTGLKELCTDWQMRNGEPNDHSDAAYDAGCVERLGTLNARAGAVVGGMAGTLPRFIRYVGRLDAAAAAVASGETKRFTGVMCESYHDIWMELHEDLIVLQGIDRTAEGSY